MTACGHLICPADTHVLAYRTPVCRRLSGRFRAVFGAFWSVSGGQRICPLPVMPSVRVFWQTHRLTRICPGSVRTRPSPCFFFSATRLPLCPCRVAIERWPELTYKEVVPLAGSMGGVLPDSACNVVKAAPMSGDVDTTPLEVTLGVVIQNWHGDKVQTGGLTHMWPKFQMRGVGRGNFLKWLSTFRSG